MSKISQRYSTPESVANSRKSLRKNNITDDVFYVTDIKNLRELEFDFNIPGVNDEWKMRFKLLFIECCGGYDDSDKQSLVGNGSSISSKHLALRRWVTWACENLIDVPLTQWKEVDFRDFLRDALRNNITLSGSDSEKELLGMRSISVIAVCMNISRKGYLKGTLIDGVTCDLPTNFLQTSLEDVLIENGTSFYEWTKGGSWESIPITVTMMLLANAIDLLRSSTTKFLVAYFNQQRSELRVGMRSLFVNSYFSYFCKYGKMRSTCQESKDAFIALKASIDDTIGNKETGFPLSHEVINEHCRNVHDACIVIMLALTGVRVSELTSVCSDDYKQEVDGTWVFNSELIKTNFGLSEVRTMSGLVAEAASTLVDLSYVTKKNRLDGQALPLFGRYYNRDDFDTDSNIRDVLRSTSGGSFRYRLNKYYQHFLEDFEGDIELLCPSIHPHRFRHSFVEFALRRFDGNVIEAIRQHFRHHAGSYFTHCYTDNKLSEEVKNSLERAYIRELLERMVDGGESEDFTGPAAAYVKRIAKDINYLDISEVDAFIEELSEEYELLAAHEYGFCLVRKETRHLAKCLNKKTQIPILENGCFELCSGCANSMHSKKGNKESITRIAVSHQNMLENFPIKGTTAHNVSENTVKRARIILNEMEA